MEAIAISGMIIPALLFIFAIYLIVWPIVIHGYIKKMYLVLCEILKATKEVK